MKFIHEMHISAPPHEVLCCGMTKEKKLPVKSLLQHLMLLPYLVGFLVKNKVWFVARMYWGNTCGNKTEALLFPVIIGSKGTKWITVVILSCKRKWTLLMEKTNNVLKQSDRNWIKTRAMGKRMESLMLSVKIPINPCLRGCKKRIFLADWK